MTGERRINYRCSEQEFQALDDKRHAERTTWQSLLDGFFRGWLHNASGTMGRHASAVSRWTAEEQQLAATFVEWMRDTDPREKPYREALTVILKGYRKQKEKQVEAGEPGAPRTDSAMKDGRSTDGQADSVPDRPRRLRHGG